MPKRNYDGDPLDQSWKAGPWANEGETVKKGSNGEDGEGDSTVGWMPEHVDEDALTDLERDILKALILPPDAPKTHIADRLDCSYGSVKNVELQLIKRERPDTNYPVPPAEDYDDLRPKGKRVVDAWAENPDASASELADKADCSYPTARGAMRYYSEIMESIRDDD